jgi:peptidyl-prolyl cis-trans isomerase D
LHSRQTILYNGKVMLKILRESAIERPWLIRTIIGLLAAVFIVTMGWWGFEQNQDENVITVDNDKIPREEYQRKYQDMLSQYKDFIPKELSEDQLKEMVVEQLIASRLWTQTAKNMGISVTTTELRNAISAIPEFQRNGAFDPGHYKKVLASVRWTPAMFERAFRADLMREKARTMVRESVAATADELAGAQAALASQLIPSMPMEQIGSPQERALRVVLFQKQQQAVRAYQEALKSRAQVSVRRELL